MWSLDGRSAFGRSNRWFAAQPRRTLAALLIGILLGLGMLACALTVRGWFDRPTAYLSTGVAPVLIAYFAFYVPRAMRAARAGESWSPHD
jgi:hypothetical protein